MAVRLPAGSANMTDLECPFLYPAYLYITVLQRRLLNGHSVPNIHIGSKPHLERLLWPVGSAYRLCSGVQIADYVEVVVEVGAKLDLGLVYGQ
jgi:hypothetical protein